MKQKEGAKKPFSVLCAVALVASLCLPTAALADVGASDQAQGANSAASAGQVADAQAAAGDAADAGAAQPAKEAADGEALAAETAVQSDDEGAAVQAEGVAAIGDTQYATLQDAIDAAKDGDTIKLLADVSVDKLTEIHKAITLDLGGKTLSRKGSVLDIYSTVTLKNGTVTVDDGASETGAVWVNNQASLTVEKDVTITAPDSCFGVAFDKSCDGAKIVFSGTVKGGNGITVNGLVKAPNQLIVDGANLEVADHGIYQAGMASTSFTISNTTIKAGKTGIEVRAGNLTVDNCIISGGTDDIECNPNDRGATTDNAGIAIAQHTTKQAINVQVNGGSISGKYAIYESNPQGNSAEDIAKVKLSVTNGKLVGDIYSEDVAGFISGGNFSPTCPKADYIADGYVAVENGSKTYDVVKSGASAGTGEAKGDAAVIPSEIKPEISSDSANELANVAASAAKDIKDGKKPSDLALDDSQSIQNLAGQVKDGDTVSVTLAVDAQPAAKPDSDIASKKKSDEEQYDIDISVGMLVTVTDKEGKQKPTAYSKVTKLPQGIEITVTVDPSFIKDKNVRIARNHEGTVDFIEPTKVDYATGEITFTTNLFSSYAVLASAKPAPVVTHAVSFVDKFNNVTNVADVEDGQVVAQPKDPSFDGYEFVGWFTDEAAQNKYDFSTPVKGDLTLYAGYKKVEQQPSGDNGKGDNGDTADKPADTADAPAATALAQTGDNVAPIALGAVALGALLIAAGALVLRRRSQR